MKNITDIRRKPYDKPADMIVQAIDMKQRA